MNLRKRPQHDDVSPFTNESQRIGRIGEEFKISFIENDNHPFRNPRYEAVDRAPRNQSASGIIWVRDEDQACFPRDRFPYRLQILLISGTRHLDEVGAKRGADQLVNDKCVFRGDHLILPFGVEKRVAEEFDYLI